MQSSSLQPQTRFGLADENWFRPAQRALVTLSLGFLLTSSTLIFGQQVSELPRPQYYLAKEVFGSGRIPDAADGFQTALKRARKVGGQSWVDRIPPLVMLGECYYEQGNLAAAMEQYDAALMLLLQNQNWINQLEFSVERLPFLEGAAKGIQWFPRSQPSRSVENPEALQLAVDLSQAQAGPGNTAIAPVSLVTRLDAPEVLRALGTAMFRRWEILGPLAEHSPLSEPLAQYFNQRPNTNAPWVQASWSVLSGVSRLSSAADADSALRLRQGILIGNQFDYFMSSLGLIALAGVEAKNGNLPDAITSLQDATLFAAFFEQHSELAMALERLAGLACATQRVNLLVPLQSASDWAKSRSTLACSAGFAGAAELATYGNELAQAERLNVLCATALRSRDISLPRRLAQLAFNRALIAFLQDRRPQGQASLESSLAAMHGSAQTGAVAKPVFQIQMTLNLLAEGKLSTSDAEAILDELLDASVEASWRQNPLETLATWTTASLPAYERHLELAKIREDQDQMFLRMDRLQRQGLYESLTLGGRMLSWRYALGNSIGLSNEVVQATQRAIAQKPQLAALRSQVARLEQEISAGPLPVDERQLAPDIKKKFSDLGQAASSYESLLAAQSLCRQPLPRLAPGTLTMEQVREQLGEEDLLLAFATTSQAVFAVAIKKQEVAFWELTNGSSLSESLQRVLQTIGLSRGPKNLPSEVVSADASWRRDLQSLYQGLQLDKIQNMLASSQRVIVVPHGSLWYLPFELLPDPDRQGQPWLATKSVVYVPTIGALPYAFHPAQPARESVGIYGKFFSPDTDQNKTAAERASAAVPNSELISILERIALPSMSWMHLRGDQIWIAANAAMGPTGGVWDSALTPVPKPKQWRIGGWLETGRRSPKSLVALGFEANVSKNQLGNGSELFLPACALTLSGNQSTVLSRWAVGGKSSSKLLARYLAESRVSDASLAWRRAILALWPEDLLVSQEPRLMPAGPEQNTLTKGSHPLLWCGYMHLGDRIQSDPDQP